MGDVPGEFLYVLFSQRKSGWMNCEQVFGILTSGPFPMGEVSDGCVEEHLARCSGCRRFAEALRPAFDIDRESLPPYETRNLPGYWGESSFILDSTYANPQEEEFTLAVVNERSQREASGTASQTSLVFAQASSQETSGEISLATSFATRVARKVRLTRLKLKTDRSIFWPCFLGTVLGVAAAYGAYQTILAFL